MYGKKYLDDENFSLCLYAHTHKHAHAHNPLILCMCVKSAKHIKYIDQWGQLSLTGHYYSVPHIIYW